MKITIEIESDEDLQKLANLLRNEEVTIVDAQATRKAMIHDLALRYNAPLPDDYRFDREEAHER